MALPCGCCVEPGFTATIISPSPQFSTVTPTWFAERNHTLTAIEHAVQAGDGDLTASLVENSGLQHVLRGEGIRLRNVLAGASYELARRPGVALVAAANALEAGDLVEADAALAQVA